MHISRFEFVLLCCEVGVGDYNFVSETEEKMDPLGFLVCRGSSVGNWIGGWNFCCWPKLEKFKQNRDEKELRNRGKKKGREEREEKERRRRGREKERKWEEEKKEMERCREPRGKVIKRWLQIYVVKVGDAVYHMVVAFKEKLIPSTGTIMILYRIYGGHVE